MKGSVFIDTNIFIYAFRNSDQAKRRKARKLIFEHLKNSSLSISFQVVQEFINASLKMNPSIATSTEFSKFISKVLFPAWKINPSHLLYTEAIKIRTKFQFSFYDSLIICAAIEAECDKLYSEDLQHNQKIQGLKVINPFK